MTQISQRLLALAVVTVATETFAIAGPHHPPPPRHPVVIHHHVPPPPPPHKVVVRRPPTTVVVRESAPAVVYTQDMVATSTRINGGEFFRLGGVPSSSEIIATVGQQIVFTLEENASTGYTWAIGGNGNNVVEVAVSHNPPANPGLVGAPGSASVRVIARNPGEAQLIFQYQRPGDNTIAGTMQCRVAVNPPVVISNPAPQTVIVNPAPATTVIHAPAPVIAKVANGDLRLQPYQAYTWEMLPANAHFDMAKPGKDLVRFYLEERHGYRWQYHNDSPEIHVSVSHGKVRAANDGTNRQILCTEVEVKANRPGQGYFTLELKRDDGSVLRGLNLRAFVR